LIVERDRFGVVHSEQDLDGGINAVMDKGADCMIACLDAQKQARVALLQPLGIRSRQVDFFRRLRASQREQRETRVRRRKVGQIRNWLLEQGLYQRSWTNLLKIAVDDALAFRDAFQDRYEAAVAGAQGNEALVHLISFADDVDIFAKLT
jgi:hypothetical protein